MTRLGLVAAGLLAGCASLVGTADDQPATSTATPGAAPLSSDEEQTPGAVPGAIPGAVPAAEPAAEPDSAISGQLTARLRHRRSGGDQDTDLDTLLSVDVNDPQTDDWSAHMLGRANYDVDGKQSADDGPFFSIDDTYSHRATGRLHSAWVDLHRVGPFDRVRLGRQVRYEAPVLVTFDGAEAQLAEQGDWRWTGGAYAGQTYHIHESSPDQDGVYGLWTQARPWSGGRAKVELMNLRDDLPSGKERNDLIAVNLWQALGESLRLHGVWTQLDGDTRDSKLDATWYDAPDDLLVQLSYKRLHSTQTRYAVEADPYFEVLQEYEPYDEIRARISKGFEDDATLEVGADSRTLADSSDVGTFNREFDRWFVTSTFYDVAVEDLSLALTGETWDGDGDEVSTWGLDLTRDMDEDSRISFGSYYSLYKNDFLLDTERERVRTYYLRWRHEASESTTWTVGYEKEVARLNVQTLTARMSWRF